MDNLLFVYGSLLRGMHNHNILSNAEYRGRGRTVHKHVMYSLIYYPAVKETLQGNEYVYNEYVYGELYKVPAMKSIDELEGAPGHYYRKRVIIQTLPEDICIPVPELEAWMYFINTSCEGRPHVRGGNWPKYIKNVKKATYS